MSTFDLKKFLINEGMTRVSRDRKRLLKESEENNENIVTVRAGHQFEDIWGHGMSPEDIDIFRDGEDDMYLRGDIESWDEIEPGRYFVYSDAVGNEEDVKDYFGTDIISSIPWDYSFTVSSHSNPYDNEGFSLARIGRNLREGKISRDRKRLLKEDTEDQNLFFKKWLDLIKDPKNSELGQVESVPEDLKDWAEDMDYEQWRDSDRNVAGGTTIMVDKEEVHSPEELMSKFEPGKYIVVDNDFLYYVGEELGMTEDEFEAMIDGLNSHELWVETPVSVAGVEHFFRIPDNF